MKLTLRLLGICCILVVGSCTTVQSVKDNEKNPANTAVSKEKSAESGKKSPIPNKKPESSSTDTGAEKNTKAPIEPKTEQPVPELSPWQLNRAVLAQGRAGFYPLHKNGRIVALYHDLDGNGLLDPITLFVGTDDLFQADITKLSDFSRVFSPDVQPIHCWLVVFYQEEGGLKLGPQVNLGKRVVIEGLKELNLASGGKNMPYSISVDFQSNEGAVNEWLFFHESEIKRFTVKETLSVRPEVEDIDNDGVQDVLFFEKSFEEGTGYETFISWYKWNGSTYVENGVTNIVRNLKDFLERARSFMITGEWDKFFQGVLDDSEYKSVKEKKLEKEQVLSRIFIQTSESSDQTAPSQGLMDLHIQDVIFPEIFENPFQRTDNDRYLFPLRVRVIAQEGEFLYVSRILMGKNPFQKRQFSFIMAHEYVHN